MQSSRIYVNVSYAQKDEAKTKGAKWEPQYKKWYFITKHNISFQRSWIILHLELFTIIGQKHFK